MKSPLRDGKVSMIQMTMQFITTDQQLINSFGKCKNRMQWTIICKCFCISFETWLYL